MGRRRRMRPMNQPSVLRPNLPYRRRPWLSRQRYGPIPGGSSDPRSEEHTSELQSLMRISYAVFCLKQKPLFFILFLLFFLSTISLFLSSFFFIISFFFFFLF